MSSFDDRKKAMEGKFFRDEEMNFKAVSRRRKLLGEWAAEKMHLDDEEALSYALGIVRFGVENTKEGAVVEKVVSDLKEAGLEVEQSEVRDKMEELHRLARIQIEKQFQEGAL